MDNFPLHPSSFNQNNGGPTDYRGGDIISNQLIFPNAHPLFPSTRVRIDLHEDDILFRKLFQYLDRNKSNKVGVLCRRRDAGGTNGNSLMASTDSSILLPHMKKNDAKASELKDMWQSDGTTTTRAKSIFSDTSTSRLNTDHCSNFLNVVHNSQPVLAPKDNYDQPHCSLNQRLNAAVPPSRLVASSFSHLPAPADDGPSNIEPNDGGNLNDLYDVGCLCRIVQFSTANPASNVASYVQLDSLCRFRIKEYTQTTPFRVATIQLLSDDTSNGASNSAENVECEALSLSLQQKTMEVLKLKLPAQLLDQLLVKFKVPSNPSTLSYFAASLLVNVSPSEKQLILEETDVCERLRRVLLLVSRAIEAQNLSDEINSKLQRQMAGEMRESLLRRKLAELQNELRILRRGRLEGSHIGKAARNDSCGGTEDHDWLDDDTEEDDITRLHRMLKSAQMSEVATNVAKRELRRLQSIRPHHPDYIVTRTYLETLANLPWNKSAPEQLDMIAAESILNSDHYGLDAVKKRILEFLAVRKTRADIGGPILCLHGPPGVGKTSLGQSIAKALGRKFYKISLGGVRDEAELRGHRRTYVGSLPGSLIQAMSTVGYNNPVLLLDEIDKLAYNNAVLNPSACLLEILDSNENKTFKDHFLAVPFDLSKVVFICTANSLFSMPRPLRDRLEIINVHGYTPLEKLHIANKHLLPRQLEMHGFQSGTQKKSSVSETKNCTELITKKSTDSLNTDILGSHPVLTISDDALLYIITRYTTESGVRQLERHLATICRWAAMKIQKVDAKNNLTVPVHVEKAEITNILGVELFDESVAERLTTPGVAMGLAVGAVGGDILFIEATKIKGTGKLIVTGQLGEVMQESVRAALSLLQAKALSESHIGESHASMVSVSSLPSAILQPNAPLLSVSSTASAKALAKLGCSTGSESSRFGNPNRLIFPSTAHHYANINRELNATTSGVNRNTKDASRQNEYRLRISPELFHGVDVHVHFPVGSIPKDGPSAGLATTVALASLFTGRLVKSDTAFSGEITLRGNVLSVGGIKEKLLAAHRGNITQVVLPHGSIPQLRDVPDEVLSVLTIIPVATVDEALRVAFLQHGEQSYDGASTNPRQTKTQSAEAETQSQLRCAESRSIATCRPESFAALCLDFLSPMSVQPKEYVPAYYF